MAHQSYGFFCIAAMSVVPVPFVAWRATTSTMHAAYAMASNRRCSAALAGPFGAGGTTWRFVEPGSVESDVFRWVHGVDDGSIKRERACPVFRAKEYPSIFIQEILWRHTSKKNLLSNPGIDRAVSV
jgi:hypothetical protein